MHIYAYLCISMDIYVYLSYLRIALHIYAYLCISTHIYAHLCISMPIYAYLCISTLNCAYAHPCISTHICAYLCIPMHIWLIFFWVPFLLGPVGAGGGGNLYRITRYHPFCLKTLIFLWFSLIFDGLFCRQPWHTS